MYELTNVTKSYSRKVTALDSVSLVIPAGQRVAIQGPTGGGKSTLLQMLGLLDRPTAGVLGFGGVDVAGFADRCLTGLRAEKIGFVFQSYNLIPTLSAQENVEAALEPLALPAAERRARAAAALRSVGLADRTGHLPGELSGGQQQRVAIARAIVKKPEVLLADEPTGNLDEATRDEIMELLEALWRDNGLTLIIVTHDSAVAARAERQLVLTAGRLSEKTPGMPVATAVASAG